jgi:hypothetical protein
MIINGFESGFLRPFYGLLLRCRCRLGCLHCKVCDFVLPQDHVPDLQLLSNGQWVPANCPLRAAMLKGRLGGLVLAWHTHSTGAHAEAQEEQQQCTLAGGLAH